MSEQLFSLSVPADPRCLKAIRAFFGSLLAEHCGEDADMIVLALDESCSNVLRHRQGGADGERLHVQAVVGPRRVRFRIADFCCPGDVPRIKPRDLKSVRPGGLGTHYIERIMDRVDFEPDPERPGRMVLVLEKTLARSRAEGVPPGGRP